MIPWAQWGMFVLGAVVGMAVMAACARAGYVDRDQERARLRHALDDLLCAIERAPTLTGEHNRALDLAMKRAREALDG